MSAENTAVTSETKQLPASKTEQLLELIAFELAHTRLRDAASSDLQLTELENAIAEKQASLDILPLKLKADRHGVKVKFFYKSWTGEFHTPSEKIAKTLEGHTWHDPKLSAAIVEAEERRMNIHVTWRLPQSSIGQRPSAGLYTKLEYTLEYDQSSR